MGKAVLLVPLGGLLLMGASPDTAQEQVYRETENRELVFKHYPAGSLRRGEHGTVAFEVETFRDGRLRSCTVTMSSGFGGLDDATCDLIVRYARFPNAEARSDGRGTLSGQVRWDLPEGLVKAVPPPPAERAKTTLAAADERLVCRRTIQVGSLRKRTKLCLTRSDWAKAEEGARAQTEEMRTLKGPLS